MQCHLSEVGEESRESSRSVDKHNKFSERVFAYLDQLMRTRPNSMLLANEATIMFSLNKTSEWLKSLSDEETASIIETSRKRARKLRDNFKTYEQIIFSQVVWTCTILLYPFYKLCLCYSFKCNLF